MKNRISTHFYVKETRKDRKGLAPIYLRITINGERAEVTTNKKVNPVLWDKSTERVVGITPLHIPKIVCYYQWMDLRTIYTQIIVGLVAMVGIRQYMCIAYGTSTTLL
jgi:hypothetical protein